MPSKPSKPVLKQATLSFSASKSSASTGKSGKKTSTITISREASASEPLQSKATSNAATKGKEVVKVDSSDEEVNLDDIVLPESDPESDDEEVEEDDEDDKDEFKAKAEAKPAPVVEKRQTRAAKAKAAVPEAKVLAVPAKAEPVEAKLPEPLKKEEVLEGVESRPSLNVKDKAYNKISSETKQKMDHAPPIHGKDLNRIDDILRVFDLSYEYGPCIGMSRLERWERAQTLGLNPPKDVYDILMTKEGLTDPRYSQNVLAGFGI
ncbi:DNA polymerase delta, subunit 4-domain-containing protein [Ephemerocybe angulata]|uniref:DNA polymerase delta, subunit 4-domain-containing protein n=1 Tax=Ephemerocybe angulata TaxID=980116 RepID=A0A8H6HVW6_9AGAR|nr:DNA polymerase delta, subunit 4-domain-containing protein [Tulosesus angulatus]